MQFVRRNYRVQLMAELQLALKAEYFHAIVDGSKLEEYRRTTPFWRKRIEGKEFSSVTVTLGYPHAYALDRRLTMPWHGYEIRTITHPHFGPDPVEVFAIDVAWREPRCPFCGKIHTGPLPCRHCGEPDMPDADE